MECLDAHTLFHHFGIKTFIIYPPISQFPSYNLGEIEGPETPVVGFRHRHKLFEKEFYREIICLELKNVSLNNLGHYTIAVPNRERCLQLVDNFQFPDNVFSRAVDVSNIQKTDVDEIKNLIKVDLGFALLRPGDSIYGHWLIDILPKIWLLDRVQKLKKIKFILHPKTPKFAIKMLSILGINQKQLIFFDPLKDKIEIEKAIYISNLRTNQLIHPAISDFSKWWGTKILNDNDFSKVNILKRFNGDHAKTKTDKRLFISRKELKNRSNKRICLNAGEIEEIAMSEYGFKVLHPQEISMKEQVRAFRNAELIVGEEGSGLHNNLFASENAHIVTLRGPRNHGLIQSGLCRAKKQTIHAIFGTVEPELEMDRNADFEISTDDFRCVMQTFEN